jgi:hypothetical protein
MKRPIGVTILAVLAGIAGVLALVKTLQFLGLFQFHLYLVPFNFDFRTFNFWAALMWGLMAWVYLWLTNMLWNQDPSAWLFLAVITVFNLVMDFTIMLGQGSWEDVNLNMVLNAIILIYVMLPGVKKSFGMQKS